MGKKTDRMYITMKEWTADFGGKKANSGTVPEGAEFAPLPYYCCALSLQPFEDPVCTKEGIVYDVTNIIPWLKKYKIDPITGKTISADDLFKLHWHKNEAGKFFCPITYKEFTEYSHIVAIRTSGHVFSFEAIDELCIKAKNMKCLITETPFTKEDIITIQDPTNLERRNLSNFHHVKLGIKPEDWAGVDPKKDIHIPERTKKLLNQMTAKFDEDQRKKKDEEKNMISAPRYDKYTEVPAQAPSFTSSSYSNKTVKVDARSISIYVDKKGYARIHTTHGDLNVELHCDMVPKTCENFLGLCEQNYYDNTEFHRLIKGFMIQGGDPTGTGKGGKSIWGKPFQDEFTPRLQHHGRGLLSMANSGKDTNNSQFFITFSACHHLNNKHSIFGRVVGGNETLAKMEQVAVDKDDHPLESIKILKITVFVDPFKELDNEEEKKKKDAEQKEKDKEANQKGLWYSAPAQDTLPKTTKVGVGKYIGTEAPAQKVNKRAPIAPAVENRPAKKQQGFGNFSNW